MTIIVCDADSLIKLTKAGAKELITKNFEVYIPELVKREIVDEAQGKPDATIIQRNIDTKRIKMIQTKMTEERVEREIKGFGLHGGEEEVYRLSMQMIYDFLSSDDQKFLRLLQTLGKKAITPASLIVLLNHKKKISTEKARTLLNNMQPHISDQEYDLCMGELEV